MKDIDARLRVEIDIGAITIAVDKFFNLTANYPKGDGDLFKARMEEHHSDALSPHVVSTNGGRQDVLSESAGPIYMNRLLYVECLYRRLRAIDSSNILADNMFIVLSSLQMVALVRAMSSVF